MEISPSSMASSALSSVSKKYNPQLTSLTLRGQLSSSLLGGVSGDAYIGGISANLLAKVYDFKAISPTTLSSYLKKVESAEQDEIGDESSKNTSAVSVQENGDDTTPEYGYVSQLQDGRGYDLDALNAIKEKMDEFYSKPENKYKNYAD